ncbi:MAG: peptide chain release factor 1 [Bacilli bacterium]
MYDRLVATEKRLNEIDQLLLSPEVTRDNNRFRDLNIERSELDPIVQKFHEFVYADKNKQDALVMANDKDPEINAMGKDELKNNTDLCDKITDELKVMLLPKDPNDGKDVIFEIKGAVGGDEADIFAGDLFRMYSHYCDKEGWKLKVVDDSISEAGGFSYIQFVVSGSNAYSRLKYESGVHRVQRVPKTEANGRIHTSTATVVVMPKVELGKVDIRNEDLKVDTYRSSGAGGQNVNKTESAVRVTHIPTGVVVSCQTEKSQIQNHEICMQMLASKLAQMEEEKKLATEAGYRSKIGSGDRNEKIRTYNYPQNRVTDHRIGFTVQKLDRIIEGDLDELIDALINYDQQQKLAGEKK